MLGSFAVASAPIAELRADNDVYPSGRSLVLALRSVDVQTSSAANVALAGQNLSATLHSVTVSLDAYLSGVSGVLGLGVATGDTGTVRNATGQALSAGINSVVTNTYQNINVSGLSLGIAFHVVSVSNSNNVTLSGLSFSGTVRRPLIWQPLHSGYGTWTDIAFGELFYGDLFGIADTPIASIVLAAPLRRNPPQAWGAVTPPVDQTWTDVVC